MIPQVVKKIDISKLEIKNYVDWDYTEVFTKLLKELNITEGEPFQIIDDSTMITKPVGDYYNCSVTWCKSSTMSESRKEEASRI